MNLALKHTLIFIGYFFAQVLIFNNFTILEIATAHVYIVALLIIPVQTPFALLITIGFVGGMLIDVFSTGVFVGGHSFSAVLMLALRNFWVFAFTNRVTFKGNESHLIQSQPLAWQLQYILPLILIYEISYQLLEAFSFDNLGLTILKIVSSVIFTGGISLILIYWIHRGSRR